MADPDHQEHLHHATGLDPLPAHTRPRRTALTSPNVPPPAVTTPCRTCNCDVHHTTSGAPTKRSELAAAEVDLRVAVDGAADDGAEGGRVEAAVERVEMRE